MSRPVDQNPRENNDFYPPKPVKPVYFCISRGFFDQNSREFRDGSPRNFVKIPNFRKNFPGKIWISARESRETRIFLHFWEFCRPKFPGIRENVDPRFSWKLKILTEISRENSEFGLVNSGKPIYSCILGACVPPDSREFSSMGHQFRGVLTKIVNFEKSGTFRKSRFFLEITFFFVKCNNLHFIMSFIIVWTYWFMYKKPIRLSLDEYQHCLIKSDNLQLISCNLWYSRKSDELGDPRKSIFT